MSYVGRFAPSPTGPLHFGSLVAAVASYCDAKAHGGKWLLRIEDLDTPRVMPGATEHIIRTLAGFGFEWEGDIVFQSERITYYQEAFTQLKSQRLIYPCTCSRKEIADSTAHQGIDGAVYAGTCLQQTIKPNTPIAWRLHVDDVLCQVHDSIQGDMAQSLLTDIGDFILKRADGVFAYQLAVVVDDALQNISHVIRGADLLNSTPRQVYLQQVLSYPTPVYGHMPIVTNTTGEKLSKQTKAVAIEVAQASHYLHLALQFLQQQPPAELSNAPAAAIWQWAFAHWDLSAIPATSPPPLSSL